MIYNRKTDPIFVKKLHENVQNHTKEEVFFLESSEMRFIENVH